MTNRPAGSGDDDLAGADGRPAYEEPSAPEGAPSLGQGAAARQIAARHARGRLWQALLHAATIVAVVSLSALAYNILNNSMGLVAYETVVDPESLAPGGDLDALSRSELAHLLEARLSDQRLRALAVGGGGEIRRGVHQRAVEVDQHAACLHRHQAPSSAARNCFSTPR